MGRSNDDVTLADLDTDAAIPSNEPEEVKAQNKFFHPSAPQVVLDTHETLLKENDEYKACFDELERVWTPFHEMAAVMEENTNRANAILHEAIMEKEDPFDIVD